MSSKKDSSPSQQDMKRRDMMRKMLSNYYGIGEESESREARDSSAGSSDMDSPDFDPDTFAAKILRNEKLSSLLRRDNELVHAVRTINGERKMLVHENYSKFISATDTIRQMHKSVEDMEVKMGLLIDDIGSICDKSAQLQRSFAPRRQEIEKLVSVRSLLHKLEFLFELPLRLQRCMELEARSQAVKYFITARNVLKQHLHVPSFKSILHEAEEIIGRLRVELQRELDSASLSQDKLAECTRLLLALGDPRERLMERFLQWHGRRFDRIIEHASKPDRQGAKERKSGEEGSAAKAKGCDAFRTYVSSFVDDFVEFSRRLGKLFPSVRDSTTEFASKHVDFTKKKFARFFEAIEILLIDSRKEEALDVAADGGDDDASKLRDAGGVATAIVASAEGGEDSAEATGSGKDAALGALSDSLNALRRSIQSAHLMAPRARLDEDAANVIERVIHYKVRVSFENLSASVQKILTDHVLSKVSDDITFDSERDPRGESSATDKNDDVAAKSSIKSSASSSFAAFVSSLLDKTLKAVDKTLCGLHPLLRVWTSFVASSDRPNRFFSELIQREMRDFFIEFNAFMERVCDPCPVASSESSDETTYEISKRPIIALQLARLSSEMEQTGITNALKILIDRLPTREVENGGADSYGRVLDIPDLIKRASNTTRKLMGFFVFIKSHKLSTIVRASICVPDWTRMEEPREVRRVAFLVKSELDAMCPKIAEVLGETYAPNSVSRRPAVRSSKTLGSRPSGFSMVPSSGLRLDIERLFAKRLQIFGDIRMNRESLVAAALRSTLKTLIECVRERTLSKNGFHQMQIDVHFLRLVAARYVRDTKVINTLADEAILSARCRCMDAKDIDPSIVEEISNRARSKAKF